MFEVWYQDNSQKNSFVELLLAIQNAFLLNKKIIFMGNGGSAAEADHLAAEFVGKCENDIGGLQALSLSSSNSIITSLANDFQFNYIYSRQIDVLAKSGDIVIGLSTSGKSINIIEALKKAKEKFCFTSLWTSNRYESHHDFIDNLIMSPTNSTPRSQEHHLFLGHLISQYLEINSPLIK
jgi:D-sedoheptulose 7-phosphate isomerase